MNNFVEKYEDLAGQNPAGLKLLSLVEENWSAWVAKVATAPWLRNWGRSPLYGCEGYTPKGAKVDEASITQFEAHNRGIIEGDVSPKIVACSGAIALAIFTSAVWGFGVDKWLKNPRSLRSGVGIDGARGPKERLRVAMLKIAELQGSRLQGDSRTYLWSGSLPCEYSELDSWLETLYHDIVQ